MRRIIAKNSNEIQIFLNLNEKWIKFYYFIGFIREFHFSDRIFTSNKEKENHLDNYLKKLDAIFYHES